MSRRPLGGRTLAVVAASLPARCAVCRDARRVGAVRLDGMRGTGVVRCPHCASAPDRPIPIYIYPWRVDRHGGNCA